MFGSIVRNMNLEDLLEFRDIDNIHLDALGTYKYDSGIGMSMNVPSIWLDIDRKKPITFRSEMIGLKQPEFREFVGFRARSNYFYNSNGRYPEFKSGTTRYNMIWCFPLSSSGYWLSSRSWDQSRS